MNKMTFTMALRVVRAAIASAGMSVSMMSLKTEAGQGFRPRDHWTLPFNCNRLKGSRWLELRALLAALCVNLCCDRRISSATFARMAGEVTGCMGKIGTYVSMPKERSLLPSCPGSPLMSCWWCWVMVARASEREVLRNVCNCARKVGRGMAWLGWY